MAFTAKDVSTLREMTGVGMMDCKNALAESDGDMDKAVAYLREKGMSAAAKKSSRIAAEGIVCAKEIDGKASIVEVNSETDFVAKNEDFQKFVGQIADVIIDANPADLDALFVAKFPGSDLTVKEMLTEKVLTIGENLQIRRFARFDTGVTVPYVHMGGKIGVLVNMKVSADIAGSDGVVELGKDVAMQIAAMRPRWLRSEQVDNSTLESEREIMLAQAINEGKPAQVAEKIVSGRINKFYEENCLLHQAFVKENKKSVSEHAAEIAKSLGGTIEICDFVRFEKGEGLEKREDNFADEVAKMTN